MPTQQMHRAGYSSRIGANPPLPALDAHGFPPSRDARGLPVLMTSHTAMERARGGSFFFG